jgi:carbamoyltransferase
MSNIVKPASCNVLGVHVGIDPAVALVQNGHVLAYSEEERHARYKHAPGFAPARALQTCLAEAAISPEAIDAIAINWDIEAFNDGRVEQFYASLATQYPVDSATKSWQRKNLSDRRADTLRRYYSQLWQHLFGSATPPRLCGIHHHFGHAYHAFSQSPFQEAVCLTLDGSGDTECTVVWRCSRKGLEPLKTIEMPHSLGWMYAAFTEYLGFEAYDGEYKVMGLAAYGRSRQDLAEFMSRIITPADDGIGYRLDPSYIHYGDHSYSGRFTDQLVADLGRMPRLADEPIGKWHEDLAFAVQSALEEAAIRLVSWAVDATGIKNVCLGGGVALNVKMNSRVFQLPKVRSVFAHPLCSDSGSAAGAALAVCRQLSGHEPEKLKSLALGYRETNDSIEKTLGFAKLEFRRVDDIVAPVARALADGLIVGWFQGRMEAGPRALGNRSILADPRAVANRDKVNAIIKFREYWRPFCPSMTFESLPLFFDRYCDAPFMIIAFQSNDLLKNLAPAIVHVDNSARVQAVHRDVDPLYHRLLEAFGEISGVPVLLNTSFNVKGEPIVCTANDALRTFWSTGLDVLAIGNYLICKPGVTISDVTASTATASLSERAFEAEQAFNRADNNSKQAVFIAAHPDDIEIGAAGTLINLQNDGWDVFACVVTDEPDPKRAALRRRESLESFTSMGLASDHVFFLGITDANVTVARENVDKLRQALCCRDICPSLVFTHSHADCHNDHRAVRELVHAAFRKKVILGFFVINSLNESQFKPQLASNIDNSFRQKRRALQFHRSQTETGRISPREVESFNRRMGELGRCGLCEPFDLTLQYGAVDRKGLRNLLASCGLVVLSIAQINGGNTGALQGSHVRQSKKHVRTVSVRPGGNRHRLTASQRKSSAPRGAIPG